MSIIKITIYSIISFLLILSFSSIAYASKFGSGPISSFSSVKKGYAKYLQVLSDGGGYVGVYAVSPDGSWGYSFYKGMTAWNDAQREAIENCNEVSSNKSCKVFAKGKKIFWDWDAMPSLEVNKINLIDKDSVRVRIGYGEIILNHHTKVNFKKYLSDCESAKKNIQMSHYACFFAVSKNGIKSSYGTPSNNYGGDIRNQAKLDAIVKCMQENNGKECFLYAEEEKIIWKQ